MPNLETGRVHCAHDVAGPRQFSVREDVPVDETRPVVRRFVVVGSSDGVVQHPTLFTNLAVEEREVRRIVCATDVFGEPDGRDGVEF